MSLKNSKVAVSYKIAGAQLQPGVYEYKERTNKGNILPEKDRLLVKEKVKESDCTIKIVLSESFVNSSIDKVEGRPGYFSDTKAHTNWLKMSEMSRLKFHLFKYVRDCGGIMDSFLII